ncbi:MAG: pyridoxal phosphate-dependent aminotransferase [Nitrososphaerota archaeon]|nr:pyridoxal phosphate-dependent aminotransferase [Nitrososphaerota archaeon]
MRGTHDKLFDWNLGLGPKSRYNLTSSGLPEPDLRSMGVRTSFEEFASEKKTETEFQAAYAEEVAKLYGVDPENVVVTAGASEAIFLVYGVLGHGFRAVVPLPNYPAMFTVPKFLGMGMAGRVSRAGGDHPSILGLTDSNNPTGRSLGDEGVGELAASKGKAKVIFVNETYREFAFSGSPQTHFGRSEEVVTCSTMTKFYGLGRLRVGWILADRPKAQRLLNGKKAISGHDSEYSLWLATQVLRQRHRFVERARLIYDRNAALVSRFLDRTEGVSSEVGPAPFCLIRYKKGPPSVDFARRLLEKTGALVSPGDFFGAPRAFRLCFTADEQTLRGGLGALADYLGRSQ